MATSDIAESGHSYAVLPSPESLYIMDMHTDRHLVLCRKLAKCVLFDFA